MRDAPSPSQLSTTSSSDAVSSCASTPTQTIPTSSLGEPNAASSPPSTETSHPGYTEESSDWPPHPYITYSYYQSTVTSTTPPISTTKSFDKFSQCLSDITSHSGYTEEWSDWLLYPNITYSYSEFERAQYFNVDQHFNVVVLTLICCCYLDKMAHWSFRQKIIPFSKGRAVRIFFTGVIFTARHVLGLYI